MRKNATSVAAERPAPQVSAAAVARAAGVSSASVSYVLNGKGGVSPETRRHIIHVANELGFRPRKSSQSTDAQRTRVVGLILPNIINPMFPGLGAGGHLRRGRVRLRGVRRHHPGRSGNARPGHVHPGGPKRGRRHHGRGTPGGRHRAAHPAAARIPYVCLSRRADFLDCDFVGIDDDAAASTLMQHMLGHGFTEIATVIGPRFSTASLAREQAFVRPPRPRGSPSAANARSAPGSTTKAAGWLPNGCFSAATTAAGRGVRERRTGHRRHGICLGAGTADSRGRGRGRL